MEALPEVKRLQPWLGDIVQDQVADAVVVP